MNRLVRFSWLILLAMSQLGHGQGNPSLWDTLISEAQQKQQQGDFASAAELYKHALKGRQDSSELWTNLGLMQYQMGLHSEALESFTRAYQIKPALYVPNLFIGMENLHLSKAKEALPFLERAVRMRSTDIQAVVALGRAYSMLGELGLAARQFGQATKLDSRDGEAWFNLGIALLGQVESDSRQISAVNRDSVYTKMLFAESLVKLRRYMEAVDLYKEVLAAADPPPCAKAELAFIYLKQGDIATAKALLAGETSIDHACALTTLAKASIQLEENSRDAAFETLQTIWSHDHGFLSANASFLIDALTPEQRTSLWAFLGEKRAIGELSDGLYDALTLKERRALFDKTDTLDKDELRHAVSQLSPKEDYAQGNYELCARGHAMHPSGNNRESLRILAVCSFLTGEFDLSATAGNLLDELSPGSGEGLYWSIKANEELANQALAKYEELKPESEQTHLLLGDTFRRNRRYDDALDEYRRAHEISPDDPAPLLGLAYGYFGNGNLGETIQMAQAALDHIPNDPETNLLLGEVFVSQQQYVIAEPFLFKALHSKPQVIPHVYALLGIVESETGRTARAIDHLTMGCESDTDGSIYYRLFRLYREVGDSKDAQAAFEKMKVVQKQHREAAVIAVQERQYVGADDVP